MLGKDIKKERTNNFMKKIPMVCVLFRFTDFGMCNFFKKKRFLNGLAIFQFSTFAKE